MRGGRPGAGARGGQAGIDGDDDEPSWPVGPACLQVGSRVAGLLTGEACAGFPDLVRPLQQVTSSNKSVTALQGMTASGGMLYRPNRLYLTPFYVPARATLARGRNYVSGQMGWRFCIYACQLFGAYPTRLLWSTDIHTPPFTAVDIDLELDRGWYFFGGVSGGVGSVSTMYMVKSESCPDLGMPSPEAMVNSGLGNWALGAPSALAGWWQNFIVSTGDDASEFDDPFPPGEHPHPSVNSNTVGAIGPMTDAGGQLYPTLFAEWSGGGL